MIELYNRITYITLKWSEYLCYGNILCFTYSFSAQFKINYLIINSWIFPCWHILVINVYQFSLSHFWSRLFNEKQCFMLIFLGFYSLSEYLEKRFVLQRSFLFIHRNRSNFSRDLRINDAFVFTINLSVYLGLFPILTLLQAAYFADANFDGFFVLLFCSTLG